MSWEDLQELIMGLISNKSITIIEVSKLKYINAVNKMTKYNLDANDLSAYLLMKERDINEIYTFDRHFDNLPEMFASDLSDAMKKYKDSLSGGQKEDVLESAREKAEEMGVDFDETPPTQQASSKAVEEVSGALPSNMIRSH